MDLICKYFPALDSLQYSRFEQLLRLLPRLNQKVNVISRKDVAHLEERHILHSMVIAKLFAFPVGATVIDAGTGGGFPGIPLSILFPETRFTLVDSTRKKISLVRESIEELGLGNVTARWERVEELDIQADFVVSRAVTAFPILYAWTWKLIRKGNQGSDNGLIAMKGGELDSELEGFRQRVRLFPVSDFYEEPFFSGKTIVYLKK
jgi:16S rRNA (guanine527-N7)-methyltransferase